MRVRVCNKPSCGCQTNVCYYVEKTNDFIVFYSEDSNREVERFDLTTFRMLVEQRSVRVEGEGFGNKAYERLKTLL